MFRRKKNRPVLKTPDEIDAMREAGRVSALALQEAGRLCVAGANTLAIDRAVEELIRAHGGVPAFKGYGGFPGSICASVNSVVVHGIPSADVVLREGDVISIDTGAVVDGWVGDNAATFTVGDVDANTRRLLGATEEAMWAGVNAAWPGARLGDVGAAVQAVAERAGFGIVRDYGGHGVGRKMHEPPHIPNYGRAGKGLRLQEGMVLAIEPMLTAGSPHVRELEDGWGVVTVDGGAAAHFENTVALTAQGPAVLTTC